MWEKMRRVARKAILKKGAEWTEEDVSKATFLMGKNICQGLTLEDKKGGK